MAGAYRTDRANITPDGAFPPTLPGVFHKNLTDLTLRLDRKVPRLVNFALTRVHFFTIRRRLHLPVSSAEKFSPSPGFRSQTESRRPQKGGAVRIRYRVLSPIQLYESPSIRQFLAHRLDVILDGFQRDQIES